MSTPDPSMPLITVWFILAGDDFDDEACSDAIGLAASSVWHQRILSLRDHADLDNMNWCYGIEKMPCYSINEVIQEVLDTIWPLRDRIISFAQANCLSLSLTCNVTIIDDRPLYDLSPQVMSQLSAMDAAFALDIFDESE